MVTLPLRAAVMVLVGVAAIVAVGRATVGDATTDVPGVASRLGDGAGRATTVAGCVGVTIT
jgi:hypothetical protein